MKSSIRPPMARRTAPGVPRLLAALALGAALVTSGCGAEDDDPGVASAADPGDDSADGDGSEESADGDDRDRMLQFTECLRDHGLEVDDPAPGEGLQLRFGPGDDQEVVEAAMEACQEFAPAGPGGGEPDSEQAEAILGHAQCMREEGVEDFPDPDPSQPGMIRLDQEVAEDPDFEAAREVCQDLLPGDGGRLGS